MNRLWLVHSLLSKNLKKGDIKMCMASVWIRKDTGEENLLKKVAIIKSKGKKLILSTLLGEKKICGG